VEQGTIKYSLLRMEPNFLFLAVQRPGVSLLCVSIPIYNWAHCMGNSIADVNRKM